MLLDTTVLIDMTRLPRSPRARRTLDFIAEARRVDDEIVTTRLNVAELYVGIEYVDDGQRAGEEQRVDDALDGLTILDFDDASARVYGRTLATLRKLGRPIDSMDALIASIALANGHALATRNVRHFENIPGLELITY